jgi:hypothetical protein
MKWYVVVALVLLALAVTPAFANITPPTVVSTNSAWQPVSNSPAGTLTWVLPATIPGCGSENSTTCEPTGHFQLDQPASGSFAEYVWFADVTGEPSDYILFGNNPGNGNFEVWFFSDPTLPTVNNDGTITWNNVTYNDGVGGASCAENTSAGCIGLSAINGLPGLTITYGSDGEASFDPFNAGYDTSDGISFGGVSTSPVPEPGTLLLLATGLVGVIRKRFVV